MKILVLSAAFVLIAVDTVERDRTPANFAQQESSRPEALTAQPVRMPWVGEKEFTPETQNPPDAEVMATHVEETAVTNAISTAAED